MSPECGPLLYFAAGLFLRMLGHHARSIDLSSIESLRLVPACGLAALIRRDVPRFVGHVS